MAVDGTDPARELQLDWLVLCSSRAGREPDAGQSQHDNHPHVSHLSVLCSWSQSPERDGCPAQESSAFMRLINRFYAQVKQNLSISQACLSPELLGRQPGSLGHGLELGPDDAGVDF